MFVYAYNNGSASAKVLKEGLNAKLIKKQNSNFKGGPNKTVINWGSSKMPNEVLKSVVANHPNAVDLASDKLKFFTHVAEHCSVPEFTTDKKVAEAWVKDGVYVFGRTELKATGGKGIVQIHNYTAWEEAPHDKIKMYVKYVPKVDEYRVHVIGDKVADIQRKAMRTGLHKEDVNWKVRNHDNGFVFVREGVDPPEEVLKQAILAVKLCGLDFGGVDIIWNNYRKKAYVLEVNTAPGLEGKTVETYINGLTELFEKKKENPEMALKYNEVNWVNNLAAGVGANLEPLFQLDDDEDEEEVYLDEDDIDDGF